MPGIALRTTMIAGYPGETEDDHHQLLDFIRETQFERLGVFAYSHEENTHAFKLEDNIPAEVKEERVGAIMAMQQEVSRELNHRKIGNVYKTLFDRKEGNYFIGRTEFDSPEVDNEVLVEASRFFVRTGDFANVKITDADDFDLYGDVVTWFLTRFENDYANYLF